MQGRTKQLSEQRSTAHRAGGGGGPSPSHMQRVGQITQHLRVGRARLGSTGPAAMGATERHRHAYVGCYTGFTEQGVLGWVGTANAGTGITRFLLTESTGKLTPTGEVVAQDSPAWLEVDPTGEFLVATHELSHHTGVPLGVGYVTSYRINRASGALTKVCTAPTGGHGNTCCAFDRTGKFLLVTRYWESGVSVLRWSPDGQIGEVVCSPQHTGHGPHPLRQSVPHPHGIHGDPHTDLVYAMDLGTDKVVQYKLNTDSGELQPLSEVFLGHESGPRGIVFHRKLRKACRFYATIFS
jgi:6-phosphogluconolactonase